MKKIIIDVDDVITGGSFLKEINKFMGTNYKEEELTSNYYIQDILLDKKDDFFKNFDKINLYSNAVLYDNCYEVLEKLNEVYDLYFCSAFVWREVPDKSSNSLKYKYDYLLKNFPFINPNNYIFMTKKLMLNCDIRIDDKLDNLGNADINLLYTAYHNKDISDEELASKNIIRVNSWLDIEEVLLRND